AELIVEQVQSLKEVREKRVKRLELRVRADLVTEDRLERLSGLAKEHAGATPLAVSIVLPGQAEALIGSTGLKVDVSDALIAAVDRLFGEKVVELGELFAGCQWLVARTGLPVPAGLLALVLLIGLLVSRLVPERAVDGG